MSRRAACDEVGEKATRANERIVEHCTKHKYVVVVREMPEFDGARFAKFIKGTDADIAQVIRRKVPREDKNSSRDRKIPAFRAFSMCLWCGVVSLWTSKRQPAWIAQWHKGGPGSLKEVPAIQAEPVTFNNHRRLDCTSLCVHNTAAMKSAG